MKSLLVALSAVAFLAVTALAQMPPGHVHQQSQQPPPPGQQKKMTMDCNQMMAAHQRMMDDMKAMDARLDDLAQKMNSATGQAKVDAIASVVNEMVGQRKTMRDSMEKMQGMMMQHMGEHMMAGGAGAMAKCPMMQQPR